MLRAIASGEEEPFGEWKLEAYELSEAFLAILESGFRKHPRPAGALRDMTTETRGGMTNRWFELVEPFESALPRTFLRAHVFRRASRSHHQSLNFSHLAPNFWARRRA